MKILVSVPVHEKPEVLLNQVQNFRRFLPDSIVVAHISKEFYERYSDGNLHGTKNLLVNPEHLSTSWGNIIQAHLSNFAFARKTLDFDFFLLHSSNDMYIRHGAEKYIEGLDAGFNHRIVREGSFWWPADAAVEDERLSRIMKKCGTTEIVASQVEGSFYRADLMERIFDMISGEFDSKAETEKYTREEIWFSTVAASVCKDGKIGFPIVFSEVHRKDRFHWKTFAVQRRMERFFPRSSRFLGTRLRNRVFNDDFFHLKTRDVRKILSCDKNFLRKNQFLDDGFGRFQLYDEKAVFAVKRVRRDSGDEVREFIGTLK